MTHGVAVSKYGINLGVDPGQTVETTFVADKVGTYWYYCTWFCSALHLEMRGRMW
jgi:nitrous-oxide reductase